MNVRINLNKLDCNLIYESLRLFLKLVIINILIMMNLYGQTDMFMFGNTRPVADAGKDVKVSSKGSIFLDGSRSYVGDGCKYDIDGILHTRLALNLIIILPLQFLYRHMVVNS